jgi:hypothetical protein
MSHRLIKFGHGDDFTVVFAPYWAVGFEQALAELPLIFVFLVLELGNVGRDAALPRAERAAGHGEDPADEVGVGAVDDPARAVPDLERQDLLAQGRFPHQGVQARDVGRPQVLAAVELLDEGRNEAVHVERGRGRGLLHDTGLYFPAHPPTDAGHAADENHEARQHVLLCQAQQIPQISRSFDHAPAGVSGSSAKSAEDRRQGERMSTFCGHRSIERSRH